MTWSLGLKRYCRLKPYVFCFIFTSVSCASAPMGAHAALFRGEQALKTAQATGRPQTDDAGRHLALAGAQLEQAHALAASGRVQEAACAAERSALDSALSTAFNSLDAP